MTFVDTNVFMHAVGRPHPLQEEARAVFVRALDEGLPLATSAEVLQELLHAYLPVGRLDAMDAAWSLAESRMSAIWSIEPEDVRFGRELADAYPSLGARDLLHVSCCRRRGVDRIHSFDRALAAVFG